MITLEITTGELQILRRALQIYARSYQDLRTRERDPAHKANLQTYVEAADELNTKLYGLLKQEQRSPT